MIASGRAAPDQTQQPRSPSGAPKQVAWTLALGPSSASLPDTLAGSWTRRGAAGTHTDASDTGSRLTHRPQCQSLTATMTSKEKSQTTQLLPGCGFLFCTLRVQFPVTCKSAPDDTAGCTRVTPLPSTRRHQPSPWSSLNRTVPSGVSAPGALTASKDLRGSSCLQEWTRSHLSAGAKSLPSM